MLARTSVAGLPVSIVAEKFQVVLMFLLVLLLLAVACSNPENRVTQAQFAVASQWTTDGLTAAVTLFLAITCAELFNQGTWQHVWAAKSVADMRKGERRRPLKKETMRGRTSFCSPRSQRSVRSPSDPSRLSTGRQDSAWDPSWCSCS